MIKITGRPRTTPRQSKIIINHGAGGLGDTLLGAFAVKGLAATFPDKTIVYRINSKWITFLQLFDIPAALTHHQHDECADVPLNAMPGDLQMNMGYVREMESCLFVSRLDRYCKNIKCSKPLLPKLKERNELLNRGRRYQNSIILSPFSTWHGREYPLMSFLTLERMLTDEGYNVVILDATDERFPGRHNSFKCDTIIDRSAVEVTSIILNAAVFIGNDSGLAHLSGMLGVPTIALCGQVDGNKIYNFYPHVKAMTGHLDCKFCCWRPKKGYDSSRCEPICANLASISPQEILKVVQYYTCTDKTCVDQQRMDNIRHLLRETFDLPGAVAELGVWRGGSAVQMWNCTPSKKLILFDTFAGLPFTEEGCHHEPGEFAASEEEVRALLGARPVTIYKGIFPNNLPEDKVYSLVHVDADLYESTKAAIAYFWPRMSPGGCLVFDDAMDWADTPGVSRAIREHFDDKQIECHVPIQVVIRKP